MKEIYNKVSFMFKSKKY